MTSRFYCCLIPHLLANISSIDSNTNISFVYSNHFNIVLLPPLLVITQDQLYFIIKFMSSGSWCNYMKYQLAGTLVSYLIQMHHHSLGGNPPSPSQVLLAPIYSIHPYSPHLHLNYYHNSSHLILNQMEGQYQQFKSEDLPSSENSSEDIHQHSQAQEQLIQLLIAQKRPIFVVEGKQDTRPSEEQIQREQLQYKILTYNRKEKSLEELSRKFIDSFQGKDGIIMELDKVTLQLKVQRRRIYDIVNIFQSLGVMKKSSKNKYYWLGLKQAIWRIQSIAQNQSQYCLKRQKSLENLSGRFLYIFINSPQPVSLQKASQDLIAGCDGASSKTKIRRLYDIVNVFKSIGLVRKIQLNHKKSLYQYQGTTALTQLITMKRQSSPIQTRHSQQSLNNSPNIFAQNDFTPMISQINLNRFQSHQTYPCGMENAIYPKQFNPKIFFPAIIQVSSLKTIMTESVGDIYPQY